jgi:hypothetical protein
LQLERLLSEANTHTISIGGHAWSVELGPDMRLPNQGMWVDLRVGTSPPAVDHDPDFTH